MRVAIVFSVSAWGCTGGKDAAESEFVSLEIEQSPAEVTIGETLSLEAVATRDNGETEVVTDQAIWESTDLAVASVDLGTVETLGSGEVTVTASYDGLSDEHMLEVIDMGPYDANISGDWSPQHGEQGLTFWVRLIDDADGTVIACGSAVEPSAIWSVSATDVLMSGHVYHAEAFADVNGDGEANDPGHMYTGNPKPPASKDQVFQVPHFGAAPLWEGAGCQEGTALLSAP